MNTNTLRRLDTFFGVIITTLLFLWPKKKVQSPKKIAIIRLWTLGESLLILPLVERLHKEHKYHISVIALKQSAGVFRETNCYDELIVIQSLKDIFKLYNKFDLVIDTEPFLYFSAVLSFIIGKSSIGYRGRFRAHLYGTPMRYNDQIHAAVNFTRLLEPLDIIFSPEKLTSLKYDTKDKIAVDKLIPTAKKIIGIHAGTAPTSPWRSWPKDRFADLIDALIQKDYFIVLTGSPGEQEYNDSIISLVDKKLHKNILNLAGKTNIPQLSYFCTQVNYFISNDTGPMHLAAAMGAKTIGLFGPNLPVRFGPLGKGNVSIYKAKGVIEESPCVNVHKADFHTCPCQGKCMQLISVEDILRYIA